MDREKQIEEMAKDLCRLPDTCEKCLVGTITRSECTARKYAERAYNAGYRKIYDDLQRQCTCYALGCQMAEELKKDVARGIFAEIEKKVKASIVIYFEEMNKEHIKDTPLYDRCSGSVFAFKNMEDFLAQLKKKWEVEE